MLVCKENPHGRVIWWSFRARPPMHTALCRQNEARGSCWLILQTLALPVPTSSLGNSLTGCREALLKPACACEPQHSSDTLP